MTESFNPYRKWLGIPEQDQPANHYRLLGVELFESDPDVIANAADGRMAQLKNYQAGKYSQDSQRILNEIAAAKICLLNPAKRAEYDRKLKQIVAAKGSDNEEMRDGTSAEVVFLEFAPRSALSSMPRASRWHSRWQLPLILGGASVLLITAMAFWMRENVGDTSSEHVRASLPSRDSTALTKPAPTDTPPKSATSKEPVKSSPPAKPASDQGKKPEKPQEAPTKQPPSEPIPKKPVPPVKPTEPKETPSPEPAAGPKQLAVPSEAEQQAAEAKIREIFGRELAAAKTADQKLDLAAKLSKQGHATADDPAVRYVLLRMAGEWTAGAGELGEALDIVDQMRDGYDMDALGMKADLLAKAVEANRAAGKGESHVGATIDAAMTIVDEAVAADEFETASRAGRLAVATARAAKDTQLTRDMTTRLREADRLKLKYSTVKKAIDSLAVNPADADANLALGQWRCFTKGDWAKGLPLLRKGSDANLAKLAEQDLTQPKEAADQIALADAWWALSESEQGPAKTAVQTHAAHWYKQALPRLPSLDKLKVKKRLESLAAAREAKKQHVASSLSGRGVVQKGNVALASHGSKVSGIQEHPEYLCDGVTQAYGSPETYVQTSFGQCPCEWIITLDKIYQLREIRFLLWDKKERYYTYTISTSIDGKNFTPLVDHSRGQWSSWQKIQFPPKPIKQIKLTGLSNSGAKFFAVIELEAYCIPPASSGKQH